MVTRKQEKLIIYKAELAEINERIRRRMIGQKMHDYGMKGLIMSMVWNNKDKKSPSRREQKRIKKLEKKIKEIEK